nr:hypothetical protein [uncultured Kingella sp.]
MISKGSLKTIFRFSGCLFPSGAMATAKISSLFLGAIISSSTSVLPI